MITSNSSIMYKFLNKLIHCDTLFKQIRKTESLGLSPQSKFVYYITYTNKSTKQIYVKKNLHKNTTRNVKIHTVTKYILRHQKSQRHKRVWPT